MYNFSILFYDGVGGDIMNNNDLFKNLNVNVKPIEIPALHINRDIENNIRIIEEANRERVRKQEEDRIALHKQTKYLEEIRNKMYDIKDIMEVLRINSNQTAEILPLLTEILLLSQSTTVEQASSKFDDILDKLKGFKDNFELYESLHGMAMGGYEYIKMKLKGEI